MLPPDLSDRFQEFFHALRQMQQTATNTPLDRTTLKQTLDRVQQLFQRRMTHLNLDELTSVEASRIQSYLTEIDKQLRLLGMDAIFLQAARQSATQAQRQQQLCDRVRTLISYCEAILGLGTENS